MPDTYASFDLPYSLGWDEIELLDQKADQLLVALDNYAAEHGAHQTPEYLRWHGQWKLWRDEHRWWIYRVGAEVRQEFEQWGADFNGFLADAIDAGVVQAGEIDYMPTRLPTSEEEEDKWEGALDTAKRAVGAALVLGLLYLWKK